MKLWITIFLTVVTTIEKGHCLQCYVCTNCEDLSQIKTEYCGVPKTTSSPVTPLPTLPYTFATPSTTPTTPCTPTTTHTPIKTTTLEPSFNYACYKVNIKVNDTTTKERGCVRFPKGTNACLTIKNEIENEAEISNCEYCYDDGCNSSAALRLSFLTSFIIFIVKMFI